MTEAENGSGFILNHNSPKIVQQPEIIKPLKEHQSASLARMLHMEYNRNIKIRKY